MSLSNSSEVTDGIIREKIENMFSLIERIFTRVYWFYKKVIKEDDEYMIFWQASTSIGIFIMFYLIAIMATIYGIFKLEILRFEKWKYFVVSIILIIAINKYFFKKKQYYEKIAINKLNERLNYYDIFVFLFIVLSFFSFFWRMFAITNPN